MIFLYAVSGTLNILTTTLTFILSILVPCVMEMNPVNFTMFTIVAFFAVSVFNKEVHFEFVRKLNLECLHLILATVKTLYTSLSSCSSLFDGIRQAFHHLW